MRRIVALLSYICLGVTLAMAQSAKSQYEQLLDGLNDSSLPLFNLIIDMDSLNENGITDGYVEISDYQCRIVPQRVTAKFRAEVKYRGASAAAYSKKSFSLKFLDSRGDDLDLNLFGIRDDNNWVLDAMAIDRLRMRNRVCFDIWNEISHTPYETKYDDRNGTKGLFVEVFVNGSYQGMYCLSDKIDRKLLGLKKSQSDNNGNVTVKGLLYKGIFWDNEGSCSIFLLGYDNQPTDTVCWNAWELQYPSDSPSDKTWQPMMDLIDFCTGSYADFCEHYNDYFYVDNLVDYFVFTSALNVDDNLYKNTFLSTVDISQGHRFLITPWDMDMSLGGKYDGDYYDELTNLVRYDWRPPYDRIYMDNIDNLKDKIAERWRELSATLLAPDSVNVRLDTYAAQMIESGAWEREYSVWNNRPVPLKESVSDEVDYVKAWYKRNYDYLNETWGKEQAVMDGYLILPPTYSIYTPDGHKVDASDIDGLERGLYIIGNYKVLK